MSEAERCEHGYLGFCAHGCHVRERETPLTKPLLCRLGLHSRCYVASCPGATLGRPTHPRVHCHRCGLQFRTPINVGFMVAAALLSVAASCPVPQPGDQPVVVGPCPSDAGPTPCPSGTTCVEAALPSGVTYKACVRDPRVPPPPSPPASPAPSPTASPSTTPPSPLPSPSASPSAPPPSPLPSPSPTPPPLGYGVTPRAADVPHLAAIWIPTDDYGPSCLRDKHRGRYAPALADAVARVRRETPEVFDARGRVLYAIQFYRGVFRALYDSGHAAVVDSNEVGIARVGDFNYRENYQIIDSDGDPRYSSRANVASCTRRPGDDPQDDVLWPDSGPRPTPTPWPSAPPPSPPPCVPGVVRVPGCVTGPEWVREQLASGDLEMRGDLAHNPPRDYFDPRTGNKVDPESRGVLYTFEQWVGVWPEGQACARITCPSPSPSPSAQPSPSPAPTPPPGGGLDDPRWCARPLPEGVINFPLFPGATEFPVGGEGRACPSCYPSDLVSDCGVKVRSVGAPGRKSVFTATCHSRAPYCPHRADSLRCDVVWGCQRCPAWYVTAGNATIATQGDCYFADVRARDTGDVTVTVCAPGTAPGHPSCSSVVQHLPAPLGVMPRSRARFDEPDTRRGRARRKRWDQPGPVWE